MLSLNWVEGVKTGGFLGLVLTASLTTSMISERDPVSINKEEGRGDGSVIKMLCPSSMRTRVQTSKCAHIWRGYKNTKYIDMKVERNKEDNFNWPLTSTFKHTYRTSLTCLLTHAFTSPPPTHIDTQTHNTHRYTFKQTLCTDTFTVILVFMFNVVYDFRRYRNW